MAQNKFKTAEEHKPEQVLPRKSRKRFGVDFSLMGSFNISAYYIFKNINFIFFLAFLGIIYIANSHYAVKVIKEIKEKQQNLEKISWESNARKSELMYESMQSRIMEKVDNLNLKPISGKPKIIVVDKIEN
jgi:hypothetical protein